jgi:7-carboxy-7-deazaguanine synthase
MTYSVKELYYTLQGEGANAGRAAILLRFAGCNLWSGLEQDRDRGPGGCSRWCDTDFADTSGPGGGKYQSATQLAAAAAKAWPAPDRSRPLVVCTGGEPLLQLDEPLVDALHLEGFEVAIETNGTKRAPRSVDWVCVSPKVGGTLVLEAGDELKLVFPQKGAEPELFEDLHFTHFYLQPMDGLRRAENTKLALEYCLQNPRWRLSLQTHKFLGIP